MLIRPSLFPEELVCGYLGRVMRMNGVTSKQDIRTLILIWAGISKKSGRYISYLELLSNVAAMELALFAKEHSLIPLRRGITGSQPELLHGNKANRSLCGSNGMRLVRKGAYFCAECVDEDQCFHGQSYWRREHQIPGLLWCQKHITPLKFVEKESAFFRSPAECLHDCQSIPATWIQEARGNKYIQRYLEVCSALMERDSPLNVKHVTDLLKAKASAIGYQMQTGRVKSPLLSDAIIKAFGRPWLSAVLPALTDKPEGVLLSKMDGVITLKTSGFAVSTYVLACALLFDSADAMFNELQSISVEIDECCQRTFHIDCHALDVSQARPSSESLSMVALHSEQRSVPLSKATSTSRMCSINCHPV